MGPGIGSLEIGVLISFSCRHRIPRPSEASQSGPAFYESSVQFQSYQGLPGSSLCGRQALNAGVQDTMSSEENRLCAAGTGTEWVTGGLSEGAGERSSS